MPDTDPFAAAFTRREQLRDFYDSPMPQAIRKDIGHIDGLCRRLIAAAPMFSLAGEPGAGVREGGARGCGQGFARPRGGATRNDAVKVDRVRTVSALTTHCGGNADTIPTMSPLTGDMRGERGPIRMVSTLCTT
jgi:hypothetical protein